MPIPENCVQYLHKVIQERNRCCDIFFDTLKDLEKNCTDIFGDGVADFKFDYNIIEKSEFLRYITSTEEYYPINLQLNIPPETDIDKKGNVMPKTTLTLSIPMRFDTRSYNLLLKMSDEEPIIYGAGADALPVYVAISDEFKKICPKSPYNV